MTPDRQPIFVLGAQRSGTTLLCFMLNRHPDLYVANELPWDFYDYTSGQRTDRRELVRIFEDHQKVSGLAEGAGDGDPFDIMGCALESRAAQLGKRRWGFKDPRLTYYFPSFMEQFPDARVILIVRDCRATTRSLIEQKFHIANAMYGASLWDREVRMQREYAERCPMHFLLYEDLVASPERHLREVCEWIRVPFSEQMLEPDRNVTFKLHSGNLEATRAISAKHSEKWRTQLSPRQCAVIEAIAAEMLTHFGYPLTGRARYPSAPERWLYALQQLVMTNYWWQKRTRFAAVRRWVGRSRDHAGA